VKQQIAQGEKGLRARVWNNAVRGGGWFCVNMFKDVGCGGCVYLRECGFMGVYVCAKVWLLICAVFVSLRVRGCSLARGWGGRGKCLRVLGCGCM
jgi:hypothetical protein